MKTHYIEHPFGELSQKLRIQLLAAKKSFCPDSAEGTIATDGTSAMATVDVMKKGFLEMVGRKVIMPSWMNGVLDDQLVML
ncbi:hypothetical protein [Halomonas binhaiensis]|uniref:Uncharacterized protein n=1 Tax=Halomonas binhaiensis TaxID=2562282 RepID=A0A5C1NJ03_9GAMM|nr:hypothetical protein [Halomonas binhaiensis]QEM82257.1 hypothetical protein E4T21_12405 [Halomonas binhaiensis]